MLRLRLSVVIILAVTIATRWMDVNKGDRQNPNYHSKLVAKEFNIGAADGLFAATPPLEAVRLLLSDAATVEEPQQTCGKIVMIRQNDPTGQIFSAMDSVHVWMHVLNVIDDVRRKEEMF